MVIDNPEMRDQLVNDIIEASPGVADVNTWREFAFYLDERVRRFERDVLTNEDSAH